MRHGIAMLACGIILLLGVFLLLSSAGLDKLETYGTTLFTVVSDFVKQNNTESAQDVVNFINSQETATVFADAQVSGYDRDQVLFTAYQISFTQPQQIITQALHDCYTTPSSPNILAQSMKYGAMANMGVTAILVPMLVRFFWVYLKQD